MRCSYQYDTNLGFFCYKTNSPCDFGLKLAKECFSFIRATLHNEEIKLEPIKPIIIKDYSKEVDELYWQGADLDTLEDEELKYQLAKRIKNEEDANEEWRNYR